MDYSKIFGKENPISERVNGANNVTWDYNGGSVQISYFLQHNSFLQQLDFSHRTVGNEGAKYIAEALRGNSSLTRLHLSDNKIDREGVNHFIDALRVNKTLVMLNSNGNQLDKAVAYGNDFMRSISPNTTFKALFLEGMAFKAKKSKAD